MHASTRPTLFALLLFFISPIAAAEHNFYAGIQAGYSSVDMEKIGLDDDVNGQIYAGYMFNDWFGMELGYTDLGAFEFEGENPDDDSIDFAGAHLGITLEGKFTDTINVFAKLGVFGVRSEISSNDPTDKELDNNGTGLYYQVGLAYPVVNFMDITFSWQTFQNIDTLDLISDLQTDLNLYDLGVRFRF